ncbi:class-II fumarase/aspartase family protein [Geodermatophilus ruber]|uniref:3-carboxy-cis,cis-muconate cycloisomerase n=1 Tax=Geodermatophilus ruber TaxID=504800 RepID=A0A1I4BKJ2_9ACTN|nr:adenylosuccinate lyase family protein [Geodermatophilus ruber]SFK69245.1 3-carboxy-cis,cis-muconate cycloisomerase [Geodermatophilus ruber]
MTISGARISDSTMYGHLWGTPPVRAVFEERGRLQAWLDVLAALARAQAAEGLVPASAAEQITARARVELLDLDLVAAQTRATGHSTLGLIRALREVLPADVHPHVYVGATVQDLTDTWTSLALRTVLGEVRRDLLRAEELALDLAEQHRDTLLAGRTHGQPGAPVTFGWKAASWADEIRRHLDRLREGTPRWLVGQLGGGVGTLAAQGPRGLHVRARFCAELGLADPGISWLTARDRIAEVGSVLAMVTGTLARIGNEVYELQRPELGELTEPVPAGVVGSITMPHKRNPERSEHLDTLARLVRASTAVLLEGMTGVHERDGRSWKAEWVALPEVCLLTATSASFAVELLTGLEVDVAGMRRNLDDYTGSERALTVLTERLGKHAAQEAMQVALAQGRRAGRPMADVLVEAGLLSGQEVAALAPDAGAAGAMVDLVVARARAARAAEGEA